MLTDEDRKYILNEFLRNIFGISNVEYQKRVWIRGEGPECDDFTETVCRFFDVTDFMLKRYKDYGITEEQYHLLVKFHAAFDVFADDNDLPILFIHTPEWKKIMDMAQEVLDAFHYKK